MAGQHVRAPTDGSSAELNFRLRVAVMTEITWQDRDAAGFLSHDVYPESSGALALVEAVLRDVIIPAWPAGLQMRPTALDKHRRAIAVLFGDLQRLGLRDQAIGKHGMGDKDFVGAPFGRDVFARTVDALRAAGFLNVLGGWRWTGQPWEDGQKAPVTGSSFTTFGLTGRALDLLDTHGVVAMKLQDWLTHWARPETVVPPRAKMGSALVELKASKVRKGAVKTRGERLPVDLRDPRVTRIVAELEAQNTFVAGVGVEGAVFSGLKRVFNNGDVNGFAWQWGGRFASLGAAGYETERKGDRLDVMRIGGERVIEVDLRAAHLTILYALAGLPLDPGTSDPYAVGGFDRELIKAIITQAIGRGDVKALRWSGEAHGAYEKLAPGRSLEADLPFRPALAAVVAAHPVLESLGRPGLTVHDLNFHESEIMTRTMALLRKAGVAALPVHDCLIVPQGAEGAATAALGEGFNSYLSEVTRRPLGVTPAFKIERSSDP